MQPLRESPLLRVLQLIWATSPRRTLALATVTFLQALLPAGLAWATKCVVDLVVAGQTHPADAVAALPKALAVVTGIGVLGSLASRLAEGITAVLHTQVSQRLEGEVVSKALTLEMEHFDSPAFYDMLQRARDETAGRPMVVLTVLFSLTRDILSVVALMGLLLHVRVGPILLVMLASIPVLVVQVRLGRERYGIAHHRAQLHRHATYLTFLLTERSFVKDVKLFELGTFLKGRLTSIHRRLLADEGQLQKSRIVGLSAAEVVALVSYYSAYGLVAIEALLAHITIGELTMYVAALALAQSTAGGILLGLSRLHEGQLFLSNLFGFLDLSGKESPRMPASVGTLPRRGPWSVAVERVSFSYPGTSRRILDRVTVSVAAGELVALVGRNGSGKSTLLSLLAGLYGPSTGRILLGGLDTRDWNPTELRRHLSVAFPEAGRYPFSARDNIALGCIEAFDDTDRIMDAARRAGVHYALAALPNGYDTILGRMFEDSALDLSEGQWQQIALARVFMRDAALLLLDEPSAALDATAERRLMEQLRAMRGNRTTVFVSHRPTSMQMADRICVMDAGRIVEQGTHDALLRKGGEYARLVSTGVVSIPMVG